jgi:hypothetical protein
VDLQGLTFDSCSIVAPPGLRKIEYAPVDGITAATYERPSVNAAYNLQRSILFDDGQWYTLPFAPGTAEWEEDQQTADQGNFYRVNATALIAGDSPAIRAELNRLKQHRYLLRLTGRDGVLILLGAYEQPLGFESRFQSGGSGSDTRGHRCTFSGVCIHASPKYVPAF